MGVVILFFFAGPLLSAQSPELVLEVGSDLLSPEYSFGRLTGVGVSEDGRIFTLDGMDNAVRSYTPEGTFLVEFGRSGQGPGEFMNAADLTVRGNLVEVHDAFLNRLVEFSLDGALLDTHTLRTRLHSADFSRFPYGWVVGKTLSQVDSRVRADSVLQAVVALNPEAGRTDTLAVGAAGGGIWWEEGELTVYHALPTPFGDQLNWVRVGDTAVVITDGYSGIARLWVVTPQGLEERMRYALELQPTLRTENDLTQAVTDHSTIRTPGRSRVSGATAPTRWSAVAHLVRDDRGNFWLGRPQRRPGSKATWHVVSASFEPLGVVEFPSGFLLQAVRGGRAFGIATDELDVTLLRVYRIPEGAIRSSDGIPMN